MWLLALFLVAIIGIALSRPGQSSRRIATAVSMRAGRAGERSVSRLLRATNGIEHIDDFVFTHHRLTVQIDRLVRGADRIWVLETKHWASHVDGSAHAATWTVSGSGGRRRADRRQNPIQQNEWHCEALSAVFNIPTRSLVVVFSGSARFSNSRPAGIVFLPELATVLSQMQTARPQPRITQTWSRLSAAAGTQRRLRAAHTARLAGCAVF
jgi:hypothetical protein